MITKNKNRQSSAETKRKIVVARLRGGAIKDCATAADCAQSYVSKVLTAFILQVEGGHAGDLPDGPDPVLRWQLARAEKVELEVSAMKRDMFPVAVVRNQCQKIGKHLRDAQKTLDKLFGVEAGNIVRETLTAIDREERQMLGE